MGIALGKFDLMMTVDVDPNVLLTNKILGYFYIISTLSLFFDGFTRPPKPNNIVSPFKRLNLAILRRVDDDCYRNRNKPNNLRACDVGLREIYYKFPSKLHQNSLLRLYVNATSKSQKAHLNRSTFYYLVTVRHIEATHGASLNQVHIN